ncbi:MAG: hypothetical protein KZQ94_10275 [Candidatus Thiodiazotropha sp. (ex Troendleina suluensis)]|nr:hypothetical protein [Candidatus Thiodiazotropha sp. (ex Troendleina suluensis)]
MNSHDKEQKGNVLSFEASRRVEVLAWRKKIRWDNRPPSNLQPEQVILDVAGVLELNAVYLECLGEVARPAVDSLIDVIGYLRDWVD